MLLLRQPSHQETRLLSLQHGRRAKTIDLTARNGYFSMRTIKLITELNNAQMMHK